MTTITLPGSNTSALGVLAPVGLAAVLDDAGLGPTTFMWSSDIVPSRALVTCAASSLDEIANAVRAHAIRHTQSDSWLQATVTGLSNEGKGLLSPRSGIKGKDWEGYLQQRAHALDVLHLTELDWAMLAGLGEPAWWLASDKDPQPDKGASRWEMKTRNRGEEVVTNRLGLLAKAVGSRECEGVLVGLLGDAVRDECGRDKADSRTATGLTTPGPTDSVQAWLGLWSLSSLHVIPVATSGKHTQGFSQTPGVWPRRGVHPTRAALPIMSRACTWRAFRALMATAAVDSAAFGAEAEAAEARDWLKEQGVVALIRFPILKGGSPSAPERQVQSGTVDVL